MESLPEDERNRLQQMLDGKVPTSKSEAASSDMPEVLAFDEDTDEAEFEEHDLYGASGDKVQFVYQICKWEKLLASIPDKVIGLVELDPPYAIDYNSLYASDTNQNDEDWTLEEFQDNMSRLLDQLYPKLLDASWILCWTGYEHVEWLNGVAQDIGYGIQRPGFWFKPGGTANSLKSNLISNYETYLLFRKGQATFNTKSLKAGFECESVAASRKYHQWQKPLEVYQRFLDALGRSGSIFLSPFAGSGSSMICAALNDMIPVGCDKSSKYFFQFYKTLKEHLNVEQADLSALAPMDSD
jgi:DNA modification methylase